MFLRVIFQLIMQKTSLWHEIFLVFLVLFWIWAAVAGELAGAELAKMP